MLREEPGEAQALYEDILINVTAFFRDPEVFESAQGLRLPAPPARAGPAKRPIRIWVPGCSTGRGGLLDRDRSLRVARRTADTNPPIQIFATDVSESAIEKARAGVYLENSMADVSPERLQALLHQEDGGWQVSKSIRDVCVFARQNVTTDPPFSNLDLISCRNLLIYLEPVLQKRVVPLLHYALQARRLSPFLGNAETIAGFADLFTPVDRSHRIFVKRPGSLAACPSISPRSRAAPGRAEGGPALWRPRSTPGRPPEGGGPGGARPLRARRGPGQRGVRNRPVPRTDEPVPGAAPGAASFNVLKMAREGLLVTCARPS